MPAENLPTVDVVIPCYNYAHYLERCIQSVIQQENVIIRALIVDDCSPDNTEEVGRRLAAEHPQVEYIRNETNKGLVGTSNVGLMGWATAKYSIWLSADDLLCKGAVSRAAQIMDAHPNVGLVYGLARVFSHDSDIKEEYPAADQTEFESTTVSGHAFIQRFCEHKNGVASPTALVRTNIQKKIGGYNPAFPHTCDVEMWMRFATQGDIGVINAPQAYYRWHNTNMSSNYINQPMGDLREQIETCEHVRDAWGQDIPDFAKWVQDMRIRYAAESCWLAGIALERGDQDAARQCIEFARRLQPDVWKLRSWWIYQLKRLTGKAGGRLVQQLRGSRQPLYQPFHHGGQFGWWPGNR
jgi:glycosyltransferase involved in cell wall biosynthesis